MRGRSEAAKVGAMKLTFEFTVSSPEAYLAILEVLDTAVEEGKLDFEFSMFPALSALTALARHEAHKSNEDDH